jgi:hypothetical protein
MSDKAKEYLDKKGWLINSTGEYDYETMSKILQSYAGQHLKDVLEEVEKYANETEIKHGDKSAYWHYKNLLNHLKQRKG